MIKISSQNLLEMEFLTSSLKHYTKFLLPQSFEKFLSVRNKILGRHLFFSSTVKMLNLYLHALLMMTGTTLVFFFFLPILWTESHLFSQLPPPTLSFRCSAASKSLLHASCQNYVFTINSFSLCLMVFVDTRVSSSNSQILFSTVSKEDFMSSWSFNF